MSPVTSQPLLFGHQQALYDATCDAPAWALLFEHGLGKKAPTIRTAEHLHQDDRIDAAIVVAPNGVHRAWISDEVPKHAAVAWRGLDWHVDRGSGQARALARLLTRDGGRAELVWLAITYDGLLTPRGRAAVLAFVARYKQRLLLVIDGARKVRNPETLITKKVAALRQFASHVRLLNEIPSGHSVLDLYAQMKLLDSLFWIRHGIASWTAFKSRFAVIRTITAEEEEEDRALWVKPRWYDPKPPRRTMPTSPAATRTFEVVDSIRELDKLMTMIAPISTQLTKTAADVELPPKLYSRLLFDLPIEQRRVYDQLRHEFIAELESGMPTTTPMALARILRLQQIACGYLSNPDDPDAEPRRLYDDDSNDMRLRLLLERLEDTPHQAIVWARFNNDVDAICRALGPPLCTRYDGELDRFQAGKIKVCVAQASSTTMKLSLPRAPSVYYYSNSFSYLERLNSEDCVRQMTNRTSIVYYDLVAARTVDEQILGSLRACQDVATEIAGDRYRAWLEAAL